MKKRNSALILVLLSFIFVAGGCSFHKSRLTEPLIDVPSSYAGMEGREAASAPMGQWWKQLEDNTLNTLMDEVFQHNLDIAAAYERLQQSRAVLQVTDSSRGLMLNVEGSGGRTRQSGSFGGRPSESVPFEATTFNTYSLSGTASYEIDLWKKLDSRTKAAQLDTLASEQDLKALYISISAQLADLYYLAVEQRAQLELSDKTIASFQDTLDRVERRYRGGLVPALDVYQSRQNLAGARAQRPLFESILSVTLNSLSVLIGRFPDKEVGGTSSLLKDTPMFPVGIPSQLLMRRPDIEAELLRLTASDKRIGAAIADRFPSFNLIGSYGGSSDQVRNVLDSPNVFWNLLLQVAQPMLDAGRRKAEVHRTEAVFRENLARYHQTVLEAFKEVEDALAGIRASKERITLLDESVSASASALRIALDRYMQGLSDYLPVLTEQLHHFTAKSNLLSAQRQLIADRIQLMRALGGEWVNEIFTRYESNIQKTGEYNK
jgi:NodT family efflux transporter outer membrane factor (OMF) lipoprotein